MKKTILIAAVMFFAFTVAASAQALFQVGSTPVISVASCGTTELTGDIAFTQVAGSPPIQTGTITINYGVPISVPNKVVQGGATLTVKDATGAVISTTNITSANVSGSLLTLQIFPQTGTAPFTFLVNGIRVNVAGNPGLTSLSAIVASTVNLFVGGQTNVMVISSIASAIGSIDTVTGSGPSAVNTALNINAVSTSPLPGTVNIDVNEGFANAFVVGQILGLTFSAIPAGLSVDTFPLTITDSSGTVFTLVDSTGTALASSPILTSTSSNLNVFYKVTALGATSVVDVETLRIPTAVTVQFGAPSPLPQGTVTVTADVFPKLGGFPDFAGSTIPQYSGTSCQKGPITILTVATGTTNLLVPFAVFDGTFDTGITIANTTKDPFSVFQSAVPQSGTLTFNFFPQTGTTFSYTTDANSPNPATLNAGKLESGRLYAVLLSQILAKVTGAPATFTGYLIITCNFTNAHGEYFVSDFENFTHGALMLVIDPADRNNAPENLDN